MQLLAMLGAHLTYTDPHVPSLQVGRAVLNTQPEDAAAEADCVVIVTDRSAFDYARLVDRAAVIVDTRNALKAFTTGKIFRL